MQIPAFSLPSNPDIDVIFRMPTVADAMAWASASMDNEESNTTRYLREMLALPGSHDPLKWTAEDRRTALWWIFTNSRLDPKISVQYKCEYCGEDHYYDCDLTVLIDSVGMLTVEPFLAVEIPVDGEIKQWLIKPLDGEAIEHLERARAALPSEEAPNYQEELFNLEMLEIAHRAHLVDQPDDFMKAAELRYNLIQSMAIDTEFSVLAANVEKAKRELRHGLEMQIKNGECSLLLPMHSCTTIAKEKGEADAPQTRLYTPFRAGYFLPAIRPGELGHAR